MMTTLPSDSWKLQQGASQQPPSSPEMSPVHETPVLEPTSFSYPPSGLSGDAKPWKQSSPSGGGSYHSYQSQQSAGSNHNNYRWNQQQGNYQQYHNKGNHNSSMWRTADTADHSEYSQSSIWGDDHSHTSVSNFSSYAPFSARNPGEYTTSGYGGGGGGGGGGDFGFSQLSVQPGDTRFPHRRSIGPSGGAMGGAFGDDDLTGSSFYETATVAGYPTASQDNHHHHSSLGSGLDFPSTASVDSGSIPGLLPASSGSTYATAPSLFSTGSADMAPPPPPGFLESSQKAKYSHHIQPPQQFHPSSYARHDQRGGRHAGRRGPPRMQQHLVPLQELNAMPSLGRPRHMSGPKPLPARSYHADAANYEESSSLHSGQSSSIDISTSSEAIRQLMKPTYGEDSLGGDSGHSITERSEDFNFGGNGSLPPTVEDPSSLLSPPILPTVAKVAEATKDDEGSVTFHEDDEEDFIVDGFPLTEDGRRSPTSSSATSSSTGKKSEWLTRMNRKMEECPIGEMDPVEIPINAIMNGWAKSKSVQAPTQVEAWLKRATQEYAAGNKEVVPTTKMYTMAVDAWARSGMAGAAAQRAESLLQQMYDLYKAGGNEALKPTTGIFNAVINAWARSLENYAPQRAEEILNWMGNLGDLDVQPDKYTYNTVIHTYSKGGGKEAASKAQDLFERMQRDYEQGNLAAKPDTITYNCVINCWAKSMRGAEAANEAEILLSRMHDLYESGDPDVKPNVVTYGAVIDAYAKSGQRGAAAKADALLANMIRLHQTDPAKHADLMPNTYVFNTVINCWSKSKERDAASNAEEMLIAMGRLHASGMTSLKPDAFTYTAVIDAWSKSFLRGAADRASLLLDKMEAEYQKGDMNLKPNTFTYNAVINALAKSCESGAAARAERVLQNMVNRHRNGGGDDVKPTTINFNTVLDAWAKSGGGRASAERAEEILEWMDRLCKQGNKDVGPDTISFNAVLDAWARSGDRNAPRRCEQILDHMDELFRAGNPGVKPDTYTYNTLINAWAKSSLPGAASRAEQVLQVMEKRYRDGDTTFKPNTRTYTSVIDAWAKSSERQAARRCEAILNGMIKRYEATGDEDSRPNVHTANAVCNACAFSKHEDDRKEALEIAFRVFDWLASQLDLQPDSYTYTILLSVCANLIPRHETATRYAHAKAFFESCRDAGYVNDYVLRKLRQTVSEQEYLGLIEFRPDNIASLPPAWTRNTKPDAPSKNRKNKWHSRRRG